MAGWVEAVQGLARAGWLPAALGHAFMARAALAGLLLAPLLGLLSPLVVTRRLAFLSSSIGHAALTGMALGTLLGEPPQAAYWGTYGFCLLSALALTHVRRTSRLHPDTVVGVFLSFHLGLGVCLMALATRRFDIHQVEAAMFGNILTVTDTDLGLLVAIGLVVLVPLVAGYNRLLLAGLHAPVARSWGADPRRLEYLLVVGLTLVVVASLKVVGFLLVEGLVVVPAACARNLARGVRGLVLGSVAVALVCTQGGLLLSYRYPVPSGAAITLALAACFALSFVLGGGRGLGGE